METFVESNFFSCWSISLHSETKRQSRSPVVVVFVKAGILTGKLCGGG